MLIVLMFIAYNSLLLLALPLMPLYLLLRWYKGKVVFGCLRERLGLVPSISGSGAVWLHGASVGETLCLGGLIDQLDGKCVVTSVTASGKQVALQQTNASAVSLLPYDFLPTMLLAFVRLRPKALVVVENDWWPNLLMLAYLLRMPVYILSARIHEKSLHRYKRMGWFIRPLLSGAQHVYVQTKEDKERFAQLGLTEVTVLGDMKAHNVLAKHNAFVPAQRTSTPTLLVGSLHPGELSYYTKLFATLKKEFPDLRMILAPRHFHWQGLLVKAVKSLGHSYAVWDETSTTQPPGTYDILLVCTLGKLFSLYSQADIFYLGGTFVPVGGHNLLEPAVFGVPMIVGPHYENTKRVAQQLAGVGSVLVASDGSELEAHTRLLLGSSHERTVRGLSAQQWLHGEAAAVQKTIEAIATTITQH